MRIVAWNILQGAPRRATRVATAILAHRPDLVVLSEFHPDRSRALAETLGAAGLQHHASAPAGYGYEVFIASGTALQARADAQPTRAVVGGYLEVGVPAHDAVVAGVYVPVISAVGLAEKRRFWGMLHEAARRNLEESFVLIGDLNTGDFPIDKETPGRPFSSTREYQQMSKLGMVEAWRALNADVREYSWKNKQGSGFRIDHAFLSPGMHARLVSARYSHGEREAKISDHSLLIVELASVAA